MPLVFPLSSVPECLDLVALRWRDALVTCFAIDPRGTPSNKQMEGIGTGFFMECGDGVALVTADHVIEPHLDGKAGGIALMVKGCAVPLTRKFLRFPDVDLCACKFDLAELAAHGLKKIKPIPLLTDRSGQQSLGMFAAMGFPNTWNVRNRRRNQGPDSLTIFCNGAGSEPRRRHAPFQREFALEFDRKRCTPGIPNARHPGIPELQGLSGGPVFEIHVDIGRPRDDLIKFGAEFAGIVLRREPRKSQIICAARESLFPLLMAVSLHL